MSDIMNRSTNVMVTLITAYFMILCKLSCQHVFTKSEMRSYRNRAAQLFEHAYNGYLTYAYPYDELRPLTCDGQDTWGSYSLTLIDSLDTLAIIGNYSEFRRVAKLLIERIDFDRDINVSVFETNIRVVGGLLSAHLFSQRAGMELEPGWPCAGPLLDLAERVARKLLPAFNTSTGMPYGTVNLLHGVPKGETSITCTAGVTTFLLEFGALSRLTGDVIFEHTARKAIEALWQARSSLDLVGNHIDVQTGKWTAVDSGIGAGIDSYFEYLVKGAILFEDPNLMLMFNEHLEAIEQHLWREDWFMWANMNKGSITLPVFQSLEAFWPGILALTGRIDQGMKTIHNYHHVWKQFGFTPEFYNIPKAEVHVGREGYPLRPELIESTMYLYKATHDPFLIQLAVDILESIEQQAKTKCGYATVRDVRNHRLENRMESFFLAETTKYLYLMFDTDSFIHDSGFRGTIRNTPNGQCVLDAGGYVFNTEAHPIDIAALYCCSANRDEDLLALEDLHGKVDLMALFGTDPAINGRNRKTMHPAPRDTMYNVHMSENHVDITLQTIHKSQSSGLELEAAEEDGVTKPSDKSPTGTSSPSPLSSWDWEDTGDTCEALELKQYRDNLHKSDVRLLDDEKGDVFGRFVSDQTVLLTCPHQSHHHWLSLLGEMFAKESIVA